jgi:acetate kinase
MGMTPLEGLVMGTRCGDIDPALVFYIGRVAGLDDAAVETLLNQESGLKGLCGANDMRGCCGAWMPAMRRRGWRSIFTAIASASTSALIPPRSGHRRRHLHRGIGENAPAVRGSAPTGGARRPARRAQDASVSGEIAEIQSTDSAVKLLVVRTNGEREIAEQVRAVLTGHAGAFAMNRNT